MHDDATNHPRHGNTGEMLAAVTNAIVGLHRRHYGKGPTRSKSYLLDDLLVCVMRDAFTTSERTLVRVGKQDKVRATRQAFSEAMDDDLRSAVEAITGRRVLGVASQVSMRPEAAIECFFLGPEAAEPLRPLDRGAAGERPRPPV